MGELQKSILIAKDKLPFVQDITGYVQTRNFFDAERNTPTEERYELRNDWRLEVPLQVAQYLSGLVSTNLELDFGKNTEDFRPEEITFRLWEGYADLEWEKISLRIGRQTIRWGKGDRINPIDNFTPQNFKEFFNFPRAERKLPILAVYPKYFATDNWTWEGIWFPFFNKNLIAEADQDWAPFYPNNLVNAGFVFSPENKPARSFENSTWATRVIHRGSFADVSASYAYHFDQNPVYRVIGRTPVLFALGLTPSAGRVETDWVREHTMGIDFEFTHKGWGFRGESAFTTRQPFTTVRVTDDDLVERKDVLRTLVGFDYTYKSDNYINLQLSQTFIPGQASGMAARGYESSLVFRLHRNFLNDKLQFSWEGITELTDVDFYHQFDITYEPRDNLEVSTGFFFYEGELEGLWGQYDKNDQFYASVKQYY